MSNDNTFSVLLGNRPNRGLVRSTSDEPRVVIVTGDFSGWTPAVPPATPASYRLKKVSQETLDKVCAEISPGLEFSIDDGSTVISLQFTQLDDFHPDQLLRKLNIPHPSQSDNQPSDHVETTATAQPGAKHDPESQEQTLDRLLGKSAVHAERAIAGENPSDQNRIQDIVQRLARRAVNGEGGSSGAQPNPARLPFNQSQRETHTLRRLLHEPDFQRLEASWRGLDWLVRSVESDQDIDFWLLDCRREALLDDNSTPRIAVDPHLQAILSERCDTDSNTLLLADYLFEDTPEDLKLLGALGDLAARLNAELITGVGSIATQRLWENAVAATDGSDIGAPFSSETWSRFRQSPAAKQIKLALPRVLLRLPYGKATDPIDTYEFEELPTHTSKQLLWGNPAYACAILWLAQSQRGSSEFGATLDGMPAYSYRCDGETLLQPATEFLFAERAIEFILGLGLIPVLGSRRSNKIQIPWQQSVAGRA